MGAESVGGGALAVGGGVAEGGTEAELGMVMPRVEADEGETGGESVVAGSTGREEEAEVGAEARGASFSSSREMGESGGRVMVDHVRIGPATAVSEEWERKKRMERCR